MTPSSPVPPVAITFDFWDTLLQADTARATREARRNRVLLALRHAGAPVAAEDLDEALLRIRHEFDRKWAANEQFTGPDATALLLDRLGLQGGDAWRQGVADAFMGIGDGYLPPLTSNIEPVLRELAARGVRLGIICDVGLSPSTVLRTHLERHGLLALFDHWSFSDEVGVYKPDPTIFAHALGGLGDIDPARAAHVGDLRRTDVAGARAFGMISVRYAGANDDRSEPAGEGDRAHDAVASVAPSDAEVGDADHVIHDHADLLGVLGFA